MKVSEINKLGMIDYSISRQVEEEKIINVLEKEYYILFGVECERLIPINKYESNSKCKIMGYNSIALIKYEDGK